MLTRHPERGATAILVAVSLLLLVGIAALAVDLGAGWNNRRQNQTSADLAALAGAIESVGATAEASARDAVFKYVEGNLDATYAASEWQAMWSQCTDPDKPAGFNSVTAPAGWSVAYVDCISGSTEEIRVRIPDQLLSTNFGRVLGVMQLRSSATAHAGVKFRSEGSVRPFGVLNGLASGSTCLTSSPSGLAAPPCDGPDSGNFGTLNSQTWGPPWNKNTIIDCGLPGNPELATNIANGVDHMIGRAPTFPGSGGPHSAFPAGTTRLDECDSSSGTALAADNSPRIGMVNTMRADTGFNLFQATMAGLINGQDADFPNADPAPAPLLQQTVSGFPTVDLRERISGNQYQYTLDNTPLWYHLRDMADIVNEGSLVSTDPLYSLCDANAISKAGDPSTAMDACLKAYDAEGATFVLFEDTLDDGPRFGYAPEFHFTTWGSGNHWQPIKSYRMIYLDTFWFNCNGSYDPLKNDAPCDGSGGLVFAPTGSNGSSLQVGNGASLKQLRLDQISAFLIPANAISESVADSYPGKIRGPFDISLTR